MEDEPEIQKFIEAYRARHGKEPTREWIDMFSEIVRAKREHGIYWRNPSLGKVEAAFEQPREGVREEELFGRDLPRERIVAVLTPEFGEEVAQDIAFHLLDGIEDMAYLVALVLAPSAFSDEEVRDAVDGMIFHVANHIVAATHLSGERITDVFDLGIKIRKRDR